MRRHHDWLRQAKRKLQSARASLEAEIYEDACFLSQQGAEMAVKAVHASRHNRPEGHSVLHLLEDLRDVPPGAMDAARTLDHYYIPTRYPDAWPSGAPMDYYDRSTAEEAVELAARILEFAEGEIA
jgi:HEPN domain-containing protein